jgi:NTE family protein
VPYAAPVPGRPRQESVALVLAGGGARGAYEAGALSALVPALQARGWRPRIVIGSSVGALNAAFFAANAHRPAAELIDSALGVWRSIRWGEVVDGIVSGASLRRLLDYAGGVAGVPGARLESLLDPAPLRRTLRERIDFAQIERNVGDGTLAAAAVVALSATTGRSVVFHDGLPSPAADPERGIDYAAATLTDQHVLASAAIPALFPAVRIEQPEACRGWYFDGGTRLNTPIKPALAIGADRVVGIALGSLSTAQPALAGDERPDALDGAGQILQAMLEDQLSQDVQTLARRNEIAVAAGTAVDGLRQVPYILIAPERQDTIAGIAQRIFAERYSGPRHALRSPNIALLGRLIGGGGDVRHADLLSFLMFAPEFAEALIALGRQDAERWLGQRHAIDGLWRMGRAGSATAAR